MKLICDCGLVVHDRPQPPLGEQPNGTNLTRTTAYYVTPSLEFSRPGDVLCSIKCECGREFVHVQVTS